MSEKPSRRTFHTRLDEMVHLLRNDIRSGRLEEGKYLSSEAELGKRFQLSVNSVRKGLDILVQEGLIEKIPKVGNRVQPAAPDHKTIIRFGCHSTISLEMDMDYLLGEFHKRYPHIQVQTLEIPTTNFLNFSQEYMEADMLDIVTINDHNFQSILEHDASNLLETVEDDPSIYSFLSKAFSHNGVQKARPLVFSPLVLCYNVRHFAERGLSEPDSGWSWAELFRTAEKLAIENERYGLYFHMMARNRWPVFMLQSGMRFKPNDKGEYHLSGTKLIDSLDIGKELLGLKQAFPVTLSASDADAEQLFMHRKVSMIMTTYLGLNELKQADFSFDIAPVPCNGDYRTLLIVIGVAVNRTSKQKEAARLLADFLSSPDAQLLIRQRTLSIPANKSAAEWKGKEELKNRPSRFNLYREIIPTFRLASDLGLKTTGFNHVQREAKLYWSGLHDKETMCRNIEKVLTEDNKSSS